jgi:hypothetical protein
MASPEFAKAQYHRLGVLNFLPTDPVLIKPYLKILQSAPDAVAESVVTRLIETETEAPRPAELKRLIEDAIARPNGCYGCARCDWTGYVVLKRGSLTGAQFCPACSRDRVDHRS